MTDLTAGSGSSSDFQFPHRGTASFDEESLEEKPVDIHHFRNPGRKKAVQQNTDSDVGRFLSGGYQRVGLESVIFSR